MLILGFVLILLVFELLLLGVILRRENIIDGFFWVYQTCGCLRRPGNIGDVSVYVPGFQIPKPVDFSHSLGDHLSKNLVERLSALRTRIVIEKT